MILTEAQQGKARPKIGLALSGGGSNGMAHVGVLKVMEEAGLRPDYISGVSMGSIIGSMYAIGYSADSLHKILNQMDWELGFTRLIPESKVIFPEKEHYNNSIISLPITSKKVQLPSGLINGQQIENILSYYAWPAAGINDFSKLPIPFMCLAADLLSGNLVEMHSGYLPDAIRASSAVPTIFTPIRIDSGLLIDGGILRNYAAKEVRDMGADIVIGSYTGHQAYSEDQLQSLPGIVKQIAFIRSFEDFEGQKKLTDILIEPDLKGYSPTLFSNVDSIVEKGYQAALPYKDYFKRLADSLYNIEPLQPIENILERHDLYIDKIEITGNKIYSDNQILGVLGIRPGEKIDKDFITEKIDLIYGKTWFEKVKYRILSRNDSLVLVIDCIEEPNSRLYGSFYYDNYIRSGIIFRATFKDLITSRSLIDFDSFIGQFYRAKLSVLQFLDRNQKLGFSALFYADNTRLPMLEMRDERGGTFNRSFCTTFSVNTYLGLNHHMNVSLNFENSTFIPDYVALNNLKRISYNYYSLNYNYEVNTLDSKYFPDKGAVFHLTASTSKLLSGVIRTDYLKTTYTETNPEQFSFERTYTLSAGFKSYFPAGKMLTFTLNGNFLFSLYPDSTPSLHNLYYLGGVESLSRRSIQGIGFRSDEIATEKLAGIGTGLDIEILHDLHLTVLTNFYAVNEINKTDKITLLAGYGLGLGYMSIIGPVRIGIMHGFSTAERYYNALKGYFSIGYNF